MNVLEVMDQALTASMAGNNFNSPLHLREARDTVAELIEAGLRVVAFTSSDNVERLSGALEKAMRS